MNKLKLSIITLLLMIPFHGHADKNEIYTRGWIGGSYLEVSESICKSDYFKDNSGAIQVLPEDIKEHQSTAIFVSRIYKNTPIAASFINEGDLILSIDDILLTSMKNFRHTIDNSSPGTVSTFTISREGSTHKFPVTIGKERYKKPSHFEIFLGFGTDLDIFPDPDFSIFSLIEFRNRTTRIELNSLEYSYFKTNSERKNKDDLANAYSSEGWNLRVFPLGIGTSYIILSQETM